MKSCTSSSLYFPSINAQLKQVAINSLPIDLRNGVILRRPLVARRDEWLEIVGPTGLGNGDNTMLPFFQASPGVEQAIVKMKTYPNLKTCNVCSIPRKRYAHNNRRTKMASVESFVQCISSYLICIYRKT